MAKKLNKDCLKAISLEELKEKTLGPVGTTKRDAYERDLLAELKKSKAQEETNKD